ncbi:DUF3488 and transglutaminase-like domain-containing protein [Pleionea litopenaei]|uniref:DUF3488 and transglutaminase-like domain-containing protein n=1 Tax=Pleionea litopenaei TaxID=3070815 RepID=A0AA51X734_9GAMM|nr:DUF3488 and transglutaminase-like domain-containing protein [Pleionea sp. HL-JVS1]WMS87476.1 DUF3488 and transglutaminase-like domain-containing protein [Pleionea sp. HL-JVS1]
MRYLPQNIRVLAPGARKQLVITQLLVLLPFAILMPPQIAIFLFLAPLWVLFRLQANRPSQVNRYLVIGLCIGFSVFVFLQFKTFRGKDAGVALIVAMYSLKILESWKYRDFNLVVTLGFFIASMTFLFSQSFLLVVYVFLVFGRLVYTLMKGNTHQSDKIEWSQSAKLLIYSLPIIVVLFVFFPRLSEPLWKMPGKLAAGSGISDSMTPGDITDLNLLDDPAFRVKVDTDIQLADRQLYWRGLVFENFDGLTWRQDDRRETIPKQFDIQGADIVRYTVTLDATQQAWMFGLDVPVGYNDQFNASSAGVIISPKKIRQRVRYEGLSILNLNLEPELTPIAREINLFLPDDSNERARSWAIEQRARFTSDQAFVEFLLTFINQQPFYYTLTPPIMQSNMVDDFWFNHRKGFCEHYSSSVAFILRSANIPARIVTGYQGGEYNNIGEYYLVRQRDAHAWVEYWQESTGWTRLDPTSAVAPSRIDESLLSEMSQRGFLFDSIPDAVLLDLDWLDYFSQWSDNLSSFWNDWVIDFNSDSQFSLFKRLNLEKVPKQYLYLSVILVVALLFWFLSRRLISQHEKLDEAALIYQRLLKKLTKKGLTKRPSEGPSSFIHRASLAIDEPINPSDPKAASKASDLREIHQLYMDIRYIDKAPSREKLERFKRLVNAYR